MKRFSLFTLSMIGLTACSASMMPGNSSTSNSVSSSTTSRSFKFREILNPADRTFNEALGINDGRTVAGYYGSGASGYANQGYTAVPGFSKKDFTSENYPGASQTQVTAINGSGSTAGFWIDGAGSTHGFIDWNGMFTSYDDPNAAGVTEILGLNDSGIAVGFYIDSYGDRYGFSLNRATGTFTAVIPYYDTREVTAAGINDNGDIVGFYFSGNADYGFLEHGGTYSPLYSFEARSTMALGVNAHEAIVGTYLDDDNESHGFLLQSPLHNPQWTSIDAPNAIYGTCLNGVNDRLNMVGYYVNAGRNTIGLLVERKKM